MLFVRKHPLYQITPTHLRQFLAPPLTCRLLILNPLNAVSFLYKTHPPSQALLEKMEGQNHVKSMVLPLNGFRLPRFFDAKTCILHQIGSLVGRQLIIFHSPKNGLLPLNFHFFTAFLHLSYTRFQSGRKVFTPYIHSIFIHFAYHLGANHSAFSGKLPCILHQNAVHLAPKRSLFCTKTQCILPQIARYSHQTAGIQHKVAFNTT